MKRNRDLICSVIAAAAAIYMVVWQPEVLLRIVSHIVWGLYVPISLYLVEFVGRVMPAQMIATIGVEQLAAFFFDVAGRKVFLVNLITCSLLCHLLCLGSLALSLPFLPMVILLNIGAAAGEYLVYCKRLFPEMPKKKLLIFVLTANGLSLAVSLLVWTLQATLGGIYWAEM